MITEEDFSGMTTQQEEVVVKCCEMCGYKLKSPYKEKEVVCGACFLMVLSEPCGFCGAKEGEECTINCKGGE